MKVITVARGAMLKELTRSKKAMIDKRLCPECSKILNLKGFQISLKDFNIFTDTIATEYLITQAYCSCGYPHSNEGPPVQSYNLQVSAMTCEECQHTNMFAYEFKGDIVNPVKASGWDYHSGRLLCGRCLDKAKEQKSDD
jgi:hypothetical protein